MVDYAGATWIPNNNFFPARNGLKPRYIILHGTAGGTDATGTANYFASTQGTTNPVSSHYVIGTDGTIVQCVSEADGAWGNGVLNAGHAPFWDPSINPNNITISIEHCKPSLDNSDALTPDQQTASFKLQYDICKRWNIPMRAANADGGITGHFSLDPVNRANCPGPYPWAADWNYLNSASSTPPVQENIMIELDTPGVSQFFAPSADGYWRCVQNNHRVGGNILSFYKRFGGMGLCGLTYLGLPLTDMFVPKSGTYAQLFERGAVIDDTNRIVDHAVGLPSSEHCYLAHVDEGFAQVLISQPVSNALNEQIKTLETELAAAKASGGDPGQITQLQSEIASLQRQVDADKTKMDAIAAAIAQLGTLVK